MYKIHRYEAAPTRPPLVEAGLAQPRGLVSVLLPSGMERSLWSENMVVSARLPPKDPVRVMPGAHGDPKGGCGINLMQPYHFDCLFRYVLARRRKRFRPGWWRKQRRRMPLHGCCAATFSMQRGQLSRTRQALTRQDTAIHGLKAKRVFAVEAAHAANAIPARARAQSLPDYPGDEIFPPTNKRDAAS